MSGDVWRHELFGVLRAPVCRASDVSPWRHDVTRNRSTHDCTSFDVTRPT